MAFLLFQGLFLDAIRRGRKCLVLIATVNIGDLMFLEWVMTKRKEDEGITWYFWPSLGVSL